MKKFNIIYYSIVIPFLALWLYLDMYVQLQSLYWLIAKLTGFTIIIILAIFWRIKKGESKASVIASICIWAVWLGYMVFYKGITEYKRNVVQDKFGLVYNKTRKKLNIPDIPSNWKIDRGIRDVDWKAPDTLGHIRKEIMIDSNWNIAFEDDEYHFKAKKGVSRDISILSKYARGKSKDSIFYRYELGDSTHLISRLQADSIFAVEKVRKDY